jgi:acetyl-CoA C-acetyltransferase
MQSVYIAGIGMTKFGKDPRSLAEICHEAAQTALTSSEIQEVDAIYIGVMNPEEFTGDSNIASHIADALGLTGIPAVRIETASSAGAAAIQAGFQAVASGYYRRVLILGGEKMTHLSTSATTRVLAGVIDKEERQCGATMPALAAMITEKYREKFNLSQSRLETMLCAVALKNHGNGAHNPMAQFQKAISRETYLASKYVATPLRLYDCSPITDGAAAVVLTSEKTDVRLAGVGQGTGPLSLRGREIFTSFPATRMAAARAYQMAETSPQGIEFAEVHDAFTPFEIITTEDLGFFAPGKGGDAVLEGVTAIDGRLPVNPSGGLKARGHPVGASGLAQIVEAVKRLRGESGSKRQFNRGLTQSTGGLASNNFVTILERTDASLPRTSGFPQPARQVAKSRPAKMPMSNEGLIETFTILYVTPDGFLPPLALALVREQNGRLILAQGEENKHLKIGREVYLKRTEDYYLFTLKGRFKMVQDSLKRNLWQRARALVRKPIPADGKL